jgi:6-pyruvoyltetrahydropterin/6-carboxytetrahydropterin synthase
MYELMVRDSFAAAHSLRDYKGKCEHTHGHNYIVEAFFRSEKLGPDGLAVDFTILKDALKKVLDGLDHKHLNEDVAFFRKNNTSAENIARHIYQALKKSVKRTKVSKVSIYESENSMAAYSEE